MRLIIWGTYDKSKPRIRILLNGFRQSGLKFDEYHFPVWEEFIDKSQISGISSKLKIVTKFLIAYPLLGIRLLTSQRPDIILVAYPALFDVFFILIYAKIRNIPIVWDVFISLYNTVVEDRKIWHDKDIRSRILFILEKWALRSVDALVLDTRTHGNYIANKFTIDQKKIYTAFVGAEIERFPSCSLKKKNTPLQLLFYGQFIPLHGIDAIIDTAEQTSSDKYHWTIIGKGQEAEKIRQLLDKKKLKNVEWITWVRYEELINYISEADICLGIFGNTIKTQLVIPNKIFQVIAAGKPFITLDTPAMRELCPCTIEGMQYAASSDPADILVAIKTLESQYYNLPSTLFQDVQKQISSLSIAKEYTEILNTIFKENHEIQ